MSKKKKKKRGKVARVKRAPGAKGYLARLQALKGDVGDGFLMYGEDSDLVPTIEEWVSTGSIAVDRQIGGGWPIGAISECRGWEGSGKSSTLDQSMAYVQSIGGIAALIDTEKSRDRKWSETLGVDLDKLIVKPCDTIEEAFDAIDALCAVQESISKELNKGRSKKKRGIKPPPMLIVWDSLGGTPSQAELEGKSDDNHVGVMARRTKQNLRRLTQKLYRLRIGVVLVNHVYQPIAPFPMPLQSPGGGGVRFHTHVRVELRKTGQLRIGSAVVGHKVEVRALKNRIIGVREPVETALIYGVGVDNAYSLWDWGKQKGLISQQGQWSYLYPPAPEEPIPFQQQYLGLSEVLRSRPDLYRSLVAAYMGLTSEKQEQKETQEQDRSFEDFDS